MLRDSEGESLKILRNLSVNLKDRFTCKLYFKKKISLLNLFPQRFQEIFGVHHAKFIVVDDDVLITG
jgi:hypothetical protein